MRNLTIGIILSLISLSAAAATVDINESPGGWAGIPVEPKPVANSLADVTGVWVVNAVGGWGFCVYLLNETETEATGVKCWDVPYAVTSTRQARINYGER